MAPQRGRKKRIPEREAWLILCEGRTEKDYFAHFKSRVRSLQLHLEACPGSPKAMVREAVRRWRENRGRPDFDRVWCVVDVDDHPPEILDEAHKLAAACPAVQLVVSNPCIELWALLHFHNQEAWISRQDAHKTLEKHCPGYLPRKVLPTEQLFQLESVAIKNARRLPAGLNPSTEVPKFIEALLAAPRDRG